MGYLSSDFLSQYEGKTPEKAGILFFVTLLGKYARWLKDKKRRETWTEVCQRVVEYSLSLYQGPANQFELAKEAEDMFHYMWNLLALPAGRTMRIGGTEASDKYPESNFNCCFTVIEELEDLCDVFHLSMCSCGVGFSNEFKYVDKLHKLKTNFSIVHDNYNCLYPYVLEEETILNYDGWQGSNEIFTISIGDSKAGWVDSLRKFLAILSSNAENPIKIILNYDFIRPEGTRLNTWGGHAAGHEGLKKMFTKLEVIIKKSNGVIRPIDILDSCNHIGKNVVVGGTRRAAEICLFSENDEECLNAKLDLGYYGWSDTSEPVDYTDYDEIKHGVEVSKTIKWFSNKENEQRTMSNNSIVFTEKPTREKLHEIFRRIRRNGEPGFFNLEAASKRRPNCKGLNPCKPLNSLILTPKGYITFKQALELDQLDVILPTGKVCKASKPFKTGENKEVFRVKISNGQYLYGTDNHQHQLQNGEWIELKDLKPGDRLSYRSFSIYEIDVKDRDRYESGILAGWIHGDGSLGLRSDSTGYTTQMCIGIQEFDIAQYLEKISGCEFKPHSQKPNTCKVISSHNSSLSKRLLDEGVDLDKTNLTWLYGKDPDFKLGFIRALFTADGSVRKKNNVELYSTRKTALNVLQNILREFGIDSTISIHNYAKSYTAKDGKIRNNLDTWKLNVYRGQFTRIGFLSEAKNNLLQLQTLKKPYRYSDYQTVVDIELYSVEDVYDITVYDDSHSFIDSGIVSHNCGEILLDNKGVCNLTTVPLTSHLRYEENRVFVNWKTLRKAVRLATRIGLRQTNVTLSLPKWDLVQKRDRLLGVSKTGEMDFLDALGWSSSKEEHCSLLTELNLIANSEADDYAFEMRIPRPLLVTTTKPEGTLSLLPTVSQGMHRAFSPYYIRRFKFADFDPICKALIELGVPHEKDMTKSDSNRIVFEFPVKSNAKISAFDESLEDQFERYLTEQKCYTDHNTSCSLYVGKNEWEKAEQLTYDNWDDIIAVSFLPKEEGIYVQAPYQAISKEQYNQKIASFPDLSILSDVINKYELDEFEESSMDDMDRCSTGACPSV